MDKVILVTVTYNSSQYLKRLLEAVDKQTVKLEKMIIVDNNSNQEHKLNLKNYVGQYSFVEVLTSLENLGGAGGFEKGINYVIENYEYDWIWVMDDDAFPKEDCLENLLKYSQNTQIGILAPIIFGLELQKYQLFHHKKLSKYLNKDIPISDSIKEIGNTTKIDANAFVGPLINKRAIEKLGVPDGKLFIYGDDTEYTYRISRYYEVLLIKDAIIYHRDIIADVSTFNAQTLWKTYYMYRNRLLFINKYGHGFGKVIGKMFVYLEIQKRIIGTLIKSKYKGNRRARLKCLRRAWQDGNKNISGKTIDPQEFNKK